MAPVNLSEFATRLLATAASPERVAHAAASVVQNPMPIGPMRVGPGGIARASAICYIGDIAGRRGSDGWDVILDVPVRVGANVVVRPQRFKFGLDVGVAVRLRIVPADDLNVAVEIDEIRDGDVTTRVDAQHLPAKLVSLGYNIENEVVRRVIEHANEMLDSDEIRKARHVDLCEVIDRAWELGAILGDRAEPVAVPEVLEPPEIEVEPEDEIDAEAEVEAELGADEEEQDVPVRKHQPTLTLEFPADPQP